jgi:hypothetical protein
MMVVITMVSLLNASVYEDATVSKVHNVYDGDTITVDIFGYPDLVGK